MANLIVCCDGTWNTEDQSKEGVPIPTNVVRLFNALSERDADGKEQKRYYHPGIGTEGSVIDRIKGGAVGAGLDKNVMSAYRWLCAHHADGDRICLFGFSRGAFTVRSLGGMIGACGLLDLAEVPDKEAWKRVETAYAQCYRVKPAERGDWADAAWRFRAEPPVPIHFIGVWDTVGALGVPDNLALLNILDPPSKYAFHDTRLGANVAHARHAVALDERRATFTPTLWDEPSDCGDLKQVWFPGVHSDVGGGYPETGLSDGALKWMIEEAAAEGLAFDAGMVGQIRPDFRDVLHDSRSGVFRYLRTQPRSVPRLDADPPPPSIHPSVRERRVSPPITQAAYRRVVPLAPGQSVSMPIYAVDPWNETGIYLEAGARYHFTAAGEWLDRTLPFGPEGETETGFHAGELVHLAGTLLGQVEDLFKRVSGNEAADFAGTRRNEDMPWFALVGAIANGGNPIANQSDSDHEVFLIGAGARNRTFERPGYLYCYANDAWHFYDNNRGSVTLTVERV